MLSSNNSYVSSNLFRLLVESPGNCGSSVIHRFAQLSGQSQKQVASCFFQAPGVLIEGLSHEDAQQLNELLNQAGARTRILDSDTEIVEGVGEWEIALAVPDIKSVTEVFRSLVDLLQVQPEQAVKLLCQSPAVVMGSLSEASMKDVRARFEKAGAKVDLSRPKCARYDLYLDSKDSSSRRRLQQQLLAAGLETLGLDSESSQSSAVLAPGVDWDTLQAHRDEWLRHISGLRILNRDFARYDLVLIDAGTQLPEVAEYLAQRMGIPGKAVTRIMDALPVVVGRCLDYVQHSEHFAALTELGASVQSNLLSWQSYGLRVNSVEDRQMLPRILQLLAGFSASQARNLVSSPTPWRLEGPFTDIQVRWLRYELLRQGCDSEIMRI